MTETIELPLWLTLIVALLAAVALVDRLLMPSVRWVLRRRVNRLIDEVNTRLRLRLPAFKLTRREVLIDRLIFDPKVLAAAETFMAQGSEPREVTMARIASYAREIVPSFNAYIYFRVGYLLAKRIARWLYRVRLGYSDEVGLSKVGPNSTVVFVMNHRSNMDYVLVAYLAADQTALSYAVGEWARVWPLQQLIRSMGAYFVRRNSNDPLYRRVLERYVQMATESGVTQAYYPEGGLSRDGRLREPKLGLLDYMVKSFDPQAGRDIVFIPVGINYDRVLEDRSLLLALDKQAPKRGAGFALRTTFGFIAHNINQMLHGEWHRFGYACVNFGTPISFRDWVKARGVDLRFMPKEARFVEVGALARELMVAVGRVVPVVPVSLVASVFVAAPNRGWSEIELKSEVLSLIRRLEAAGAHVYIPRADQDYAIGVGLRMLTLRRLIIARDGLFVAQAADMPVLAYYANAIAHFQEAPAGNG